MKPNNTRPNLVTMNARLLLLILFTTVVASCAPSTPHKNPPKLLGVRTNQQGMLTQRIVLESSYTTEAIPVLTADGPRNRTHGKTTYYIEDQGKPRRELPIMFAVNANAKNYEACWPVEGTNQWFVAGTDPIGNGDKLYVVLFDESRIIRTNVFNVIPKWKSEKNEYELQDSNRTIIIRSPDGLLNYNLLEDAVTKIEK